MKYQQIAPPAHLKNHIRYVWILESNAADSMPKTFLAVSDGFPGLIFQDAGAERSVQQGEVMPQLYVYGQTIEHAIIQSPAQFSAIGIYFYPHAIKSVFGVDSGEITGGCIELDLFKKEYRLLEKLLDQRQLAGRLQLLYDYIWKLIQKNAALVEPGVDYAVQRILATRGTISLAELRDEVNMTERTMERKFRNAVGMSPKLFSRIRRFQASLDQLRARSFDNFSDIAFDQQYADQSHFIRAFKEFAGHTPARFSKQTIEMVENFPELIL